MNVHEAKTILLLYRPGTADAEDPHIAEALALAQREPELADWLELHCARQEALRAKFRQVAVPAGLKEQIISEHAASRRTLPRFPKMVLVLTTIFILLGGLVALWHFRRPADDTMDIFKNQMADIALRGYGMDLLTNDVEIRHYFEKRRSPSNYVLPAPLQKAVVVGCAVESWQNDRVSMICFRTGRLLPPNQSSDLWLFVVPRNSLKDVSATSQPRLTTVKGLITAVWARGDKIYLLGTEESEKIIQQFL